MIKTIQQTLILALCVLMPSIVKAATRSADDAKEIAAEFFQSGDVSRLGDKDALILSHVVVDSKSNPICYVFNAKDGNGFAIISADDAAMPVIGYSDTSVWQKGSVPGAAEMMVSAPIAPSQVSARRNVIARAAQTRKVLATPEWSQEAPFNNMIPNRRLTGCVGVALAEILKYHSYPAMRPASLVKDGEPAAYAWSTMRNDNHRSGYTAEQAEAVAAIVADAAIGIGTDFGMSSSSAYEVKVPYALVSLFGYDPGVSYKKRSEMTKAAWDDVIVNEIDADRPVLYSGQDVSAGHAFVCDGYEMRGSTPYFHINWGWGGSANGFYASDALNPVVSKAHSYNDLMTIIYNIKPAAGSNVWSDIHVTSDERQAGLNIDVTDISAVPSFALRAGALKNISNTDFKGRLAVALFDAAGNQKCLLNDGRNFNLVALQISKYVDFSCKLPVGVSVAAGDVIRLVTQANGAAEWLPVSGDLLAPGQAAAKDYEIPYFDVTLPAITGDYAVTADATKVIKGRDYTFTLTPMAADKVITVRANGFILTPGANNVYKLTNVLEDQQVDVIVQNAADVLSKANLWVTAGNLQNLLTDEQCASIKELTLFGSINANDFSFIRDRMKLTSLDISQCYISALGSNPANAIPTKAFMGYRSLKQIRLPKNVTTFKNGCFAQTGLTSIEIPASVGTWEYNVFVSCNGLKEIISRRKVPAWVNWCVFSGVPKSAKLVVPVGSAAAYAKKEYWADFTNVVEEDEVAPSSYFVAVSENRNIRFLAETEGTEFAPGASYVFSAEPDDTFGDTTVEVYANTTRLTPDASGRYTAKINANTLIHFEFKQPEPTTADTTWKLTADAGGTGLATEVVNVMPGKSFTVRANAIKIPAGADGMKFFAMVLTDKDGAIKEFISPVYNGSTVAAGNQSFNFGCQVVDATVKDGNLIRLATSYNKKTWNLVGADAEGVCDRIAARGNQVVYHNISMPETMNGARIEGFTSQVAHGMPFTVKVTAIAPSDRVTLAVNGVNKAVSQNVANVTVPAVTEDLDITIQIKPAGASDFVVVNVNEGELASKLAADCPARLKLVGTIHVDDFKALRAKAANIIDLDLADVTIKGAAMTANSIPENAFAPTSAGGSSALKSVVLPANLERIDQNAFARCLSITKISIPASVTFVGNGAFAQCNALKTIVMEGSTPPATGTMSPLPSNISGITLEVPRGSESAYSAAAFWKDITPKVGVKIFGIKIDTSRAFSYSSYLDLSKFEFNTQTSSKQTVSIGLPNCEKRGITEGLYRPGQVFKLYDNGVDADFLAPDAYGYGGQYQVVFDPILMNYGDQFVNHKNYPQNHTIDVVFFYPISFEFGEGAEGTKAEVKNTEGGEVYNAPNNKFVYGASGNKMTYREDRNYKFSLEAPASGIEYTVEAEQNVMLKPAKGNAAAQMELRRTTLLPDENGLYTIESLQGDAKVIVTGRIVVEEGEPLSSEILAAVSKDNVEEFTELTVTGELGEEDFDNIREKFESVETLDLSQIDNEVIPEGAFAGMESLNTVIIPETVTEIGAGAFADCVNIETITLPGVNSIGEGAFEGCTSLTSILIPASDGTPAPSGAPRKIAARSNGGISAESFRGLNPNCLIYIGENNIPDSDELNIILNKDGNRVAASDIHLDSNHSFNAPASFLLGEYTISFTEEVIASEGCDENGGWKTIMLPFQPTEMKIDAEYSQRVGSGLHLYSFDGEEAEQLTAQHQLLPNRPYLANVCAPFASVPVTFSAKARVQEGDETVYDVPFTPVPEETVAVGKEFSLYGSYDGQTRPVDYLVLNAEGSAFVSPAAADSIAVRPFSAYLVANEGVAKTEMAVGEHPIWLFNPASTGLAGTRLYRSEKIELASASQKASVYYTVDGTDPTDAEGTRRLFTAPFAMEGDGMTIKAVAEYKGGYSDVVTLDFELKKANLEYNLAHNWNWISHNVESPVAVASFATSGIDGILSQTEETVFDSKFGFVGSLTELLPAAGYKVCVTDDSWTANLSGVAFDPTASVKLHKGWNWIGTPVDEGSLLIADLLSGFEAEEGEMLVGLDGFVQADEEGVWQGSVSHMVPGTGYMLYSNSDKEFTYTILPAPETAEAAKAPVAEGNWTVDNNKYASVMPVVAELSFADGSHADIEDYMVAAFCGDECRGIGVAANGKVMINIHGNYGDVISFRLVDALDREMQAAASLLFDEDMVTTFAAPFAINVDNTTAVGEISTEGFGIRYENGSILFGGDMADVKGVEVYDLSGRLIAKTPGAGKVNVGALEGSVVTVVIRKADSASTVKLFVK